MDQLVCGQDPLVYQLVQALIATLIALTAFLTSRVRRHQKNGHADG